MEYDFSGWDKIYRDKRGAFTFELAPGKKIPVGYGDTDYLKELRKQIGEGRITPIEIESIDKSRNGCAGF